MDLTTGSPDLPRRTSSPEASTRPNPFDDSDVASRKRRRTSLSGSPSRSSDSNDDQRNDTEPSNTPTIDDAASDNAMNIDRRPATPQTPEKQLTSTNHLQEPPSSKVTINLRRNVQNDDTQIRSPSPLAEDADTDGDGDAGITDRRDIQTASEHTEAGAVDIVPRGSSSSPFSSGSPPIELVTVPDTDNDEFYDGSVEGTILEGEDQLLLDPTENFPYHDVQETRLDTAIRLITYIQTNTNLDENIIATTQAWLRDYLTFMRNTTKSRVRQSFSVHRDMWARYPDVALAMHNRKTPLHLEMDFRPVILDFYSDIIHVTTHLVLLDLGLLRDFRQTVVASTSRKEPPVLFSGPWLQCVSVLTRCEQSVEDGSSASIYSDKADLLRKLDMSQNGHYDKLVELIELLLGILDSFPRLLVHLAQAANLLANYLQTAQLRLAAASTDGRQVEASRLEQGHQLWNDMSRTLDRLIDRSVSQLHPDGVSLTTHAFRTIFNICLHGTHRLATQLRDSHQDRHPNLLPNMVPDAMAIEWRIGTLGKLIRSSQMQLRVWAVTTMCTELVALWKRYEEEPQHPMLKHLADCLLGSALIEYILGPNCHPEIIAESANILGFLLVTKTYREEHTDRFWRNVTCSQDPRVADALVRMISSILNIFDQKQLLDFCEKFLELDIEGFTASMNKLWASILGHLMDRAQKERTLLSYPPYHLCLKLLRESSVDRLASPTSQHMLMSKYKELLTFGPDDDGRARLYASCLEDISKKSPTSLGSLWCLWLTISPMAEREIKVLSKDHGFVQLVVDELEAATETRSTYGQASSFVLWGSTNQPRREIITGVILSQPDDLSGKLGNKLWDLLVGARSPSPDDRAAGWLILNEIVARSESKNPFTRTCLAQHLPCLPSHCYSSGLLDFVKQEVMKLMQFAPEFQLDDDSAVRASCLEQLWTILLTAEEHALANQAIHFLAVEVYMSPVVLSRYPSHRLRQVHSILVDRCFSQLQAAAQHIRAADVIDESENDSEAMIIIEIDEQLIRQERVFTRSLQLVRYFLDMYQTRPELSTPDLRAIMLRTPSEVEGDPAQLKYQSFDGAEQTEVKPLSIGKQNTAASLLASLRQETGFQNYKAYFRGRALHPDVRQLCQSLEDLEMHEGLILVKRAEEDITLKGCRVKLGSSALQIDIMQHFDELWQYLDLKEPLASEIYHFLTKLPAHYRILESFDDDAMSASEIIPPGHPFKALYTVHALHEYKDLTKNQEGSVVSDAIDSQHFPRRTAEEARDRSISLIIQALPDAQGHSQYSDAIQAKLVAALMRILVHWLQSTDLASFQSDLNVRKFGIDSPDTIVGIMTRAATVFDEPNFDVLSFSLEAVLWLGLLDENFGNNLMANEIFSKTMQDFMLHEKQPVRLMTIRKIRDAVNRERYVGRSSQRTARFFWSLVSQLINLAMDFPERCREVYELSQFLLRDARMRWQHEIDFATLVVEWSSLLLSHQSSEEITQVAPQDPVVKNLADLVLCCLEADTTIVESGKLPPQLGRHIFWRHLFPDTRETEDGPVQTLVLNTETRTQLCRIVFGLARHSREKLDQLLQDLAELVPVFTSEEEPDQYFFEIPQSFERFRAIRAPCGYAGLRNLSNTCYLNSLLTQLYMNTSFRDFLMSADVHDADDSQQLLFQTQKLFAFMEGSIRRCTDPTELVSCIKTYDDALIDIHSQMDVDEFYNLLFDRWEGQLLGTGEKKTFRSFFGGHLVQQVKSRECEHISERLEPFSAIQCDIKGKMSLTESLQAYVDGEVLDGDNKYKCSTCDRHVDAVKRACLKDIPDNVIFHLKRFDFNLRTLLRSKINDYFSFPAKINLAPYTVECLSGSAVEEDMFELVGVLVHAGTAESGHYYSYIRERPSQAQRPSWIEFNDDNVSYWDPGLMEASTFGGTNRTQPSDPNGPAYDKPYSAYMLFYQRSSTLQVPEGELSAPSMRQPMDSEMKAFIMEENKQILRRHCLFDPSHANLVKETFNLAKSVQALYKSRLANDNGGHAERDMVSLAARSMEALLGHFDQVICRTKDTPHFEEFSAIISNAVTFDSESAFALYNYFHARPMALRSLVQRSFDGRIRSMSAQLFLQALEKLSTFLPFVYDSAEDNSMLQRESREHFWEIRGCNPETQLDIIQGVIRVFRYMWKGFPNYIRSWEEFFRMVLEFAKMGSREVAHLLADNFFLKLCRIIMADQTLELPVPYMRMVQNIARRFTNRPPSFSAVICTADYLLHQLSPEIGPDVIVDVASERLDQQGPPFAWTSDEIAALHNHGPRRREISFFVEKLIGHDQAQIPTDRIITRMIGTSSTLDLYVANALMNCIRRDDSPHGQEPYLRASLRYLERTESLDRAGQMVLHVAKQTSRLQAVESPSLLSFFKAVLAFKRPDQDFANLIRTECIEAMPVWAPFLLVHYDSNVRMGTVDTIESELLGAEADLDDNDLAEEDRGRLITIAQRLGVACLEHLRDTFVLHQTQIGRDQAHMIIRIIHRCGQAFEIDAGSEDEVHGTGFGMLKTEVIDQLRTLVVDDMDEEGSEWDASCVSSEQMDGIAEMGLQAIKDLDE